MRALRFINTGTLVWELEKGNFLADFALFKPSSSLAVRSGVYFPAAEMRWLCWGTDPSRLRSEKQNTSTLCSEPAVSLVPACPPHPGCVVWDSRGLQMPPARGGLANFTGLRGNFPKRVYRQGWLFGSSSEPCTPRDTMGWGGPQCDNTGSPAEVFLGQAPKPNQFWKATCDHLFVGRLSCGQLNVSWGRRIEPSTSQ